MDLCASGQLNQVRDLQQLYPGLNLLTLKFLIFSFFSFVFKFPKQETVTFASVKWYLC